MLFYFVLLTVSSVLLCACGRVLAIPTHKGICVCANSLADRVCACGEKYYFWSMKTKTDTSCGASYLNCTSDIRQTKLSTSMISVHFPCVLALNNIYVESGTFQLCVELFVCIETSSKNLYEHFHSEKFCMHFCRRILTRILLGLSKCYIGDWQMSVGTL